MNLTASNVIPVSRKIGYELSVNRRYQVSRFNPDGCAFGAGGGRYLSAYRNAHDKKVSEVVAAIEVMLDGLA